MHTDLKSFSVLDNFFVNKSMLDRVEDAAPIHCVTNQSRHSPIMMKVLLPALVQRRARTEDCSRPKRPAWYKASEEDKNRFTAKVNEKLKHIEAPASILCEDVNCTHSGHTDERDSYVIDLLTAIVEVSHQTIPLSKGSDAGGKGTRLHRGLPGWKKKG